MIAERWATVQVQPDVTQHYRFTMLHRIGLPIVFAAEDIGRLPVTIEKALCRIAQEALHNVVKHAGAKQVRLTVSRDRESVSLRVEDDGSGFDPGHIEPGHLGLAGMRARAERVGGQLEVASKPGHGTRIEVVVPVAPPADEPEHDAADEPEHEAATRDVGPATAAAGQMT